MRPTAAHLHRPGAETMSEAEVRRTLDRAIRVGRVQAYEFCLRDQRWTVVLPSVTLRLLNEYEMRCVAATIREWLDDIVVVITEDPAWNEHCLECVERELHYEDSRCPHTDDGEDCTCLVREACEPCGVAWEIANSELVEL